MNNEWKYPGSRLRAWYRSWQAEALFRSRHFSSIFVTLMRGLASPLYLWANDAMGEDIDAAGYICDVGAGNGNMLWYALQTRKGKVVTLVDQSHSQLWAGRRNINAISKSNQIQTLVGSAENLPLGPHQHDLVISTGSINLWRDPSRGLSECIRILKPGGVLWIFDQAPCTSSADVLDALIMKRMFGLGLPGYTREEVEAHASAVHQISVPTNIVTDHSFYGLRYRKQMEPS